MATSLQEMKQTISEKIEKVLMTGDLKPLSVEERLEYYQNVCRSLGLNPLTSPFEYITLNGKLTLYARKNCTEQLRKIYNVSITRVETETNDGVFEVMAYAKSGEREDIDLGAVSIKGLQGDNLVNAKLKAITKAKRRVTLSICGLGFLDETEIETVPAAETPATSPALGAAAGPTVEQKKLLKKISEGLAGFDISADALKRRMWEEFGANKSADLTEEQAEKFIADLLDWQNSLEEARAENMKAAELKASVPF